MNREGCRVVIGMPPFVGVRQHSPDVSGVNQSVDRAGKVSQPQCRRLIREFKLHDASFAYTRQRQRVAQFVRSEHCVGLNARAAVLLRGGKPPRCAVGQHDNCRVIEPGKLGPATDRLVVRMRNNDSNIVRRYGRA